MSVPVFIVRKSFGAPWRGADLPDEKRRPYDQSQSGEQEEQEKHTVFHGHWGTLQP
jgi:hypothetical protein